MQISNNPEVKTIQENPSSKKPVNEYKEKMIEVFKDFDTNNDNVLDANDSTVKVLEDILFNVNNAELTMDLNDDMAKYVILRNMAKGNSISLENISERFDKAWELCQNDEEAKFLIEKLEKAFEEYAIGTGQLDLSNKRANQKNIDIELTNEAKQSYQRYCENLKSDGLEPSISLEEYTDNFIKEYKDLHQKLDDVQNLAENCISSADKMKVNGKFLAEFASHYSSLQLRIQTLEKRDEVASMKEKAVNNLNDMENVGPVKPNAPAFGL